MPDNTGSNRSNDLRQLPEPFWILSDEDLAVAIGVKDGCPGGGYQARPAGSDVIHADCDECHAIWPASSVTYDGAGYFCPMCSTTVRDIAGRFLERWAAEFDREAA